MVIFGDKVSNIGKLIILGCIGYTMYFGVLPLFISIPFVDTSYLEENRLMMTLIGTGISYLFVFWYGRTQRKKGHLEARYG